MSHVPYASTRRRHQSCPLLLPVSQIMSHATHMNESWRTCEWVMSHMWVSQVTYVSESWHICEWVMAHMWVMPHMCMSHGTHVNESCHTWEWVMSHIWVSYVTRVNESWHTCACDISHTWMSHVTHTPHSVKQPCPIFLRMPKNTMGSLVTSTQKRGRLFLNSTKCSGLSL